jgi:hypothetical protein
MNESSIGGALVSLFLFSDNFILTCLYRDRLELAVKSYIKEGPETTCFAVLLSCLVSPIRKGNE